MAFLKKENKEHTEEVYKFLTEDASEKIKRCENKKEFNYNSFILGWLIATLGMITGQIIYNLFLK